LVDNADELIGEVKTQAASVNQAFTAKFGSLSNANFEQLASNSSGQTLAIAQRFAASMAGGSLNTIFIVIVGCFFAVDPKTYHDGFVRFFPREKRSRVEDILEKCRAQLEAWILGQLLAMSIIGVLVGLGLAVIGVPFAALLGLFAGVVSFVPNLGAIVAILPALLLASSQGTPTVLTVLVLYLVVQFLESNFLTPLVQQQQTSLPPALILSAQLIAGALFGLLGVMFITPVLAVSVVLVEHLYLSKRDQGKSVLLKQMPSQTDMGQTDMGQTDMGQTEAAGS
jgi:predicted PurR-regulated permease PerM